MKTGSFEQSFGQSQSDFEAAFKKSIREFPRDKAAKFVVPRPEWKIGYSWSYEERQSGWKPTTVKVEKIVGSDSTSTPPTFLMEEGNQEISRSMETLGVLSTRKNGIITTRRDKPSQSLIWPLQSGWRNIYTLENLETKQSYTINRVMSVPGVEEVKVPAGIFKAMKIDAFDDKSGRLVAEYWYSPKVRWFVKTINYDTPETYFRERQLVSFKVDN